MGDEVPLCALVNKHIILLKLAWCQIYLEFLQEHIGPFCNQDPMGECTLDCYDIMAGYRDPYAENEWGVYFRNRTFQLYKVSGQ